MGGAGRYGLAAWQVRDAKSRFSELLDATVKKGPQVITRRGIEVAVLISLEEWNRRRRAARPSLKDLLLAPEARSTSLIAENRRLQRRAVLKFN
jgi:prevent-host-death family protein